MPTFVNDELDAIFVHIPKSAGSSVTVALRNYAPTEAQKGDDRYATRHWVPGEKVPRILASIKHNDVMVGRKVSHPNHSRAMDIQRAIGVKDFAQKYSFTFVRNPFDRLASTYHYIRKNDANPKAQMTREIGFEQYLVYHCLATPQPQSDWICDLAGNVIVKDILRVEDMNTSGDHVGNAVFGAPISFGTVNTSKNIENDKSTLWNDVPDWVVDLFLETYADDFEKTGYAPDVSPFKNGNTVSVAAEAGAWEALSRYMLPPMKKMNKVNRNLQRNIFLAAKREAESK